jgi:hypothetical protein
MSIDLDVGWLRLMTRNAFFFFQEMRYSYLWVARQVRHHRVRVGACRRKHGCPGLNHKVHT